MTARQGTTTGGTFERFGFKRCTCASGDVHGYLHDHSGRIVTQSVTNRIAAKEQLQLAIVRGFIPVEHQALIESEIDAVLPEPSEQDTRFSFRVKPEVDGRLGGNFYGVGAKIIAGLPTGYIASKSGAMFALPLFVKEGLIPEEDAGGIQNDIKTSELPDKEPYLGPFRFLVDFEITGFYGFFLSHDESTMLPGDPGSLISRTACRVFLNDAIGLGSILEEEREVLENSIAKSRLPETDEEAILLMNPFVHIVLTDS
jgi:hypothetical protein